MSVRETVQQWIAQLPDDCEQLRDLYEQARLEAAIEEAREDVRAGRVYTFEEVDRRMQEKWARRNSQS